MTGKKKEGGTRDELEEDRLPRQPRVLGDPADDRFERAGGRDRDAANQPSVRRAD
jgi:hypothetical protein